jgi:hypothetical protein
MKFAPSVFTFALISAFAVGASAQTAASSPTRAEVKAEAAAANKAGKIPTGQESVVGQDMPKKPGNTGDRAAVKDETKAANKAGTIPSGQEAVVGQDMPKKPKSEANRATVKAEAASANKAGTIPTGQESVVGQDKGTPKK